MNRPPMLMHMQIYNKDRRIGLWLPLFLLWPLALVLLIILSPLILIAVMVLWVIGWGDWALSAVKALGAAGGCVCAMRGLRVDVQNRYQTVSISVV